MHSKQILMQSVSSGSLCLTGVTLPHESTCGVSSTQQTLWLARLSISSLQHWHYFLFIYIYFATVNIDCQKELVKSLLDLSLFPPDFFCERIWHPMEQRLEGFTVMGLRLQIYAAHSCPTICCIEGLVHPITLCAAKKYVNRKVSSKKSKRIWWSEEHMRLHLFSVFYWKVVEESKDLTVVLEYHQGPTCRNLQGLKTLGADLNIFGFLSRSGHWHNWFDQNDKATRSTKTSWMFASGK